MVILQLQLIAFLVSLENSLLICRDVTSFLRKQLKNKGGNQTMIDYFTFKKITLLRRVPDMTSTKSLLENIGRRHNWWREANFGLWLALMALRSEGSLSCRTCMWHGASGFAVSSEGPPHLIVSYEKQSLLPRRTCVRNVNVDVCRRLGVETPTWTHVTLKTVHRRADGRYWHLTHLLLRLADEIIIKLALL